MASIVLVQSTQGNIDLTGDPARADGWYGYPDSLYTVAISTTNFVGRVYIEASLALIPTNADWFSIELKPTLTFLEYPLLPGAPTGFNGGDTGVRGYTFRGNFLYLRARIVRSYLYGTLLTPDEIALLGDARIILSQSQTTYSSSSTLPPIVGFTQLMNIGIGYQTYAGLNDLSIPTFRALAPGAGISMVQTADKITISATGTGSGGILSTQGSFLQLTDTPNDYINRANAVVRVNSTGNGLVFVPSPAVAVSGLINDTVGTLITSKGGTGLSTITTNSILYGSGNNAIDLIVAPINPQTVLTWTGTQFAWLPASQLTPVASVTVTQNTTTFDTPTLNFTGSGVNITETNGTAVIEIPGVSQSQFGVQTVLGKAGVVTLVDLVQNGVAPFNSSVIIISAGNTFYCTGTEQYVVVRKPTGSTTTIYMPPTPIIGNVITIKDGNGDASAHPILIGGNGHIIDNYTNGIMLNQPFSYVVLMFNGTQWNIVG